MFTISISLDKTHIFSLSISKGKAFLLKIHLQIGRQPLISPAFEENFSQLRRKNYIFSLIIRSANCILLVLNCIQKNFPGFRP